VRNSDTQTNFTPDDRRLIAPALTWHPSERTNFSVLADYQHDGSKWSQFLPAAGTLFNNPNGVIPVSTFLGEPDYDKVSRDQDPSHIREITSSRTVGICTPTIASSTSASRGRPSSEAASTVPV